MARHLRVEFPGAIYHVTSRMIGDGRLDQSKLFTDDSERERFLERLGERVEEYNVRLYQFVLMTNHFHLVFETPEANCSKFMHSILTGYTVYYNLRHGRHGHLLDGRFKAKLVDGDEYLLALSRYVHLNPVKVGGVKDLAIDERIRHLRGYRWSTYPSYIGRTKRYDFVTYGPILGEMSGNQRSWSKRYCKYVETGLAKTDEEFEAIVRKSPRSIGGEVFCAWIDELHEKLMAGQKTAEDTAIRRVVNPLRPEVVLKTVAESLGVSEADLRRRQRDSLLRVVAARCLIRHAGQTQRDAAKLLNMGSGSAVSKQIARHRDTSGEKGTSSALAKADRKLAEARRRFGEESVKS